MINSDCIISQNLPPHLGGTCASYGPNPLEGGAVSTAPALVRSSHIVQEPVSASGDKDKDKVESKNFLHIVQLEVHRTESTIQGQSPTEEVSAESNLEKVSDQAVVQERVGVVGIDVAVSSFGVCAGQGVGVAQSGSGIKGSGSDLDVGEKGGRGGRGGQPLGDGNRAEQRRDREKGQKASLQLAPSCLHVGSGNDQKVCSDKLEVVNRVPVTQSSMSRSRSTSGPNSSHDTALSGSHMADSIKFEGSAADSAVDDWSSIWT